MQFNVMPRTLTGSHLCMQQNAAAQHREHCVWLFSRVLVSGQQYVHRQETFDTAVPLPHGGRLSEMQFAHPAGHLLQKV